MSDDGSTRDLRLALVLNGGVSLAVWIGGVSAELYRAWRGDGPYATLLDITGTRLVIDVVTGASAGGLNGAFLAAGRARDLPSSVFDGLRDVWLTAGSFQELLRNPLSRKERNPPSLLQGDEFFLRKIEDVLLNWFGSAEAPPVGVDDDPFELALTATTLSPMANVQYDDDGNRIVDSQYRAQFRFTAERLRTTGNDLLAKQLARAARTSASFPGAFEPSFVQVGANNDGRVDMTGVVSFDQPMWVMDGGVLANKPVRPAIDAVRRHSFPREGRRVVVYVNPDPGRGTLTPPADPDDIPTMAAVVRKALVDLPREESIAGDLAEIRSLNRHLRTHRRTRERLLTVRPGEQGAATADRLLTLASEAYPVWLRRRWFELTDNLLRDEMECREAAPNDRVPVREGGLATFDWADLADANVTLLDAQSAMFFAAGFPTDAATLAAAPTWTYGIQAAEYICTTLLDVARRTLEIAPARSASSAASAPGAAAEAYAAATRAARNAVVQLRAEVLTQRQEVRLLQDVDREYWPAALGLGVPDAHRTSAADWVRDLQRDWPVPPATADPTRVTPTEGAWSRAGKPGAADVRARLGAAVSASVRSLLAAAPDLQHIVDECAQYWGPTFPDLVTVRDMIATLLDGLPDDAEAPTLTLRLLALYVAHATSEDLSTAETGFEFVQLSAGIPSPLDRSRREPSDKVTGLQLGHFGGFVKSSWRANDWMWGSLDGAAQLATLLIDARRIRQVHPTVDLAWAAIGRFFSGEALPPRVRAELGEWPATATTAMQKTLRTELEALYQNPTPRIDDLPRLRVAVADLLQQIVAVRELPAVAAAVTAAQREGAGCSAQAAGFVDELHRMSPDGMLKLESAAALVQRCPVGRETVAAEMGSDQLTQVMATASAVTANALSGTQSGLGPLRAAFTGVRSAMVAALVLVTNMVRRNRVANGLTLLLLAIGGTVVTAKLLGAHVPNGVLVLGFYLLAAWVVVSALTVRAVRALLPLAAVLAVIALTSVDRAEATRIFDRTVNQHGKWVVQRAGIVASLVVAAIVIAWYLVRAIRTDDEREVVALRAQIAGLDIAIAEARDNDLVDTKRRDADVAGLEKRRDEMTATVSDIRRRHRHAVVASVGWAVVAIAFWWVGSSLVRWHASAGWAGPFDFFTHWRVLFIATAIPVATFIPMLVSDTVRWFRGPKQPA